jgi:hypothetical protein
MSSPYVPSAKLALEIASKAEEAQDRGLRRPTWELRVPGGPGRLTHADPVLPRFEAVIPRFSPGWIELSAPDLLGIGGSKVMAARLSSVAG